MSEFIKRGLPLGLVTFILGFIFLDYWIAAEILTTVTIGISTWAVIISACGVGLGIINLAMHSKRKIERRQSYWYLDLWTFVILAITVLFGVIGSFGTHPFFKWLIVNAYQPIDASVFAMVAFDICAAFYRTFRVKSKEATLLIVCALIALLRNAPIMAAWVPGIVPFGDWFLQVMAGPGSRVFIIAAAIGLLGFTIRIFLHKERTVIGMVGE